MEDIQNITEISGMGNGYESACQNMLQAGWEWLNNHKEAKVKGHTYKHVYGLFEPDNKETNKLIRHIANRAPDCTGAMIQAVMGHLFYISKNGLEMWKKEVTKKRG